MQKVPFRVHCALAAVLSVSFLSGCSSFPSPSGAERGLNLLVLGFFLAVVIQHLSLFAGGRRTAANLFFPAVACLAAVRLSLTADNPLGFFPLNPLRMARLEACSLFPLLPSFQGVLRRLYPGELGLRPLRGVAAASAAFLAAGFLVPFEFLTTLSAAYIPVAVFSVTTSIRGAAEAGKARRSGSSWMTASAAAFSLVFLLDLLRVFLPLEGHSLFLFLGWAAVVALTSAGLGRRMQDAFNEAERAGRMLEKSNEALEAQVQERTRELRRLNEELRKRAETDALTGIANRRRFEEALDEEKRRAVRTGSTLSVGMFDIDYFKSYNDTYGHLQGDECLKKVAQVLSSCARRPGDLAARYGGEEFALLLPETDREGALAMVRSAALGIEQLGIPHEESPFRVVTISAGVASSAGGQKDVVLEADRALYAAKASGRNAVRESL